MIKYKGSVFESAVTTIAPYNHKDKTIEYCGVGIKTKRAYHAFSLINYLFTTVLSVSAIFLILSKLINNSGIANAFAIIGKPISLLIDGASKLASKIFSAKLLQQIQGALKKIENSELFANKACILAIGIILIVALTIIILRNCFFAKDAIVNIAKAKENVVVSSNNDVISTIRINDNGKLLKETKYKTIVYGNSNYPTLTKYIMPMIFNLTASNMENIFAMQDRGCQIACFAVFVVLAGLFFYNAVANTINAAKLDEHPSKEVPSTFDLLENFGNFVMQKISSGAKQNKA